MESITASSSAKLSLILAMTEIDRQSPITSPGRHHPLYTADPQKRNELKYLASIDLCCHRVADKTCGCRDRSLTKALQKSIFQLEIHLLVLAPLAAASAGIGLNPVDAIGC
jgi:hypothetical protein